MTTPQAWAQTYPMGPNVRSFLGIDEAGYRGHLSPRPTEEERAAFEKYIMAELAKKAPEDEEELVSLADELVAMGLPKAVLFLAENHGEAWNQVDFRGHLSLGVAAMLEKQLDRAEASFRKAQELIPEEPAPYVNLVSIFLHHGRLKEARTWCLAGLDAEPDNLRLWDLFATLLEEERDPRPVPDRLLNVAKERHSWAGLSLAANLTASGDPQYKLGLLEPLYHQGVRDSGFLVELTAALGEAGDYQRIPSMVAQAEKMGSSRLPWQLHMHAAQAQLAMERPQECLVQLDKAEQDKYLPDQARQVMDQLRYEASQSMKSVVPIDDAKHMISE